MRENLLYIGPFGEHYPLFQSIADTGGYELITTNLSMYRDDRKKQMDDLSRGIAQRTLPTPNIVVFHFSEANDGDFQGNVQIVKGIARVTRRAPVLVYGFTDEQSQTAAILFEGLNNIGTYPNTQNAGLFADNLSQQREHMRRLN